MQSSDLSLSILQLLFSALVLSQTLVNISQQLIAILLLPLKCLSEDLVVSLVLLVLTLHVHHAHTLILHLLNLVLFVL